jgi:DHA1 family inner membrane transport protein
MGGFAIGTAEFAAMSLLPFFSADFKIDEPTAGYAISAYALGVVVGAPLIAIFAAGLRRRYLLIGLMAVYAVGNGLSALAPNYPAFVLSRFLSGFPHGAYFGVAALVAASLVPLNKRSQAVSRVFLGLTVATIFGVPFANLVGLFLNWRIGFGIVAILASATAFLVWLYAPNDPPNLAARPLKELKALGSVQVWLTLGIGAIGPGGLFAVYTYLATLLMEVTQLAPAVVPFLFSVFGLGMTLGTIGVAIAGDRAPMPTIGGALVFNAIVLAFVPFAAGNAWAMVVVVFLIGCGGSLAAVLQTRLMDVAKDAQTLAAALNHAAFNVANALGPWLGGLAIHAGYGWTSTGFVGSGLALGGLLIWFVMLRVSALRAG